MTLHEYMQQNRLSYRQLGALIGRDAADVWRWARGYRVPSLEVAMKIEEITGQQVTARDLLPQGAPQ